MTQPAWYDSITEQNIRAMFAARGVESIYLKFLGTNNNSKQQVYLATDLTELALIPMGEVTTATGTSNKATAGGPIFHAKLDWTWMLPEAESPAPGAQLIYYPQYPEVRLSGLLAGSPQSPRELLSIEKRGKEAGRLLVFGAAPDHKIYAIIVGAGAPAANAFTKAFDGTQVLAYIPVSDSVSTDPRTTISRELLRIHELGWLDAAQLSSGGVMGPCSGPRCVGHTLEAHLGITMNGVAAPDFGIWEVKAHRVARFDRPAIGRVTLFTPEPDGGAYAEFGAGWFARHFGALNETETRYDFTGVHTSAARHPKTGLHMKVLGYDADSRKMTDAEGSIALVDANDEPVSSWSFAKLLQHWQRKHAFATYVAALSRPGAPFAFSYGNRAHFAEGTRFELFLRAMSNGAVFYDPGIKSELQPDSRWKAKARSQFRINFRDLGQLYDKFEEVDVARDGVRRLFDQP